MYHKLIAIAMLVVVASRAHGQGTLSIQSAGPGNNQGELTASGKWTVDAGWNRGSVLLIAWPQGGGTSQQSTATVNGDGTWSGTIAGLTSSTTYNVVANMTVFKGENVTISSNYKTAKAK